MTIVANVRVNALVPFPSLVKGINGISIAKANGVWTVGLAPMAAFSLRGNNTAIAAVASDLSVAQAQALLQNGQIWNKAVVDFNVGNMDTPIPIIIPTGFTRYRVAQVILSGASASISTATCGLFTGFGGTGQVIVTAGTAITVTSAAENILNNLQTLGTPNTATESYNLATLQFRVATPQGAPATATVTVAIQPAS